MIQLIPWSFEPAGLLATLNKQLKGRGRVCPAWIFPAGFLLAEEARAHVRADQTHR
jgi:hypothetical protein